MHPAGVKLRYRTPRTLYVPLGFVYILKYFNLKARLSLEASSTTLKLAEFLSIKYQNRSLKFSHGIKPRM